MVRRLDTAGQGMSTPKGRCEGIPQRQSRRIKKNERKGKNIYIFTDEES